MATVHGWKCIRWEDNSTGTIRTCGEDRDTIEYTFQDEDELMEFFNEQDIIDITHRSREVVSHD